MALTTPTTISAAMLATDLTVSVTSATGIVAGMLARIDDEYMIVDRSYVSGTAIPVLRRGDQGSRVVAHNALAPFLAGLPSDYTELSTYSFIPVPTWRDNLVEYSVSGAIAVPKRNTIVVLSKAGVAVMTLLAPAGDQNGMRLTITSNTAQAHTITTVNLLADGSSGSPHNTATFTTGYIGQGLVLVAYQGLWQVESSNHIAYT